MDLPIKERIKKEELVKVCGPTAFPFTLMLVCTQPTKRTKDRPIPGQKEARTTTTLRLVEYHGRERYALVWEPDRQYWVLYPPLAINTGWEVTLIRRG